MTVPVPAVAIPMILARWASWSTLAILGRAGGVAIDEDRGRSTVTVSEGTQ